MKSTFRTAAAVGLAPIGFVLWGSTALAQTAAEPAEPAEPETETAEPAYSVTSALAEVDGVTLTLGELIAIRRELPEQYQALPDEVLFNGIIEQMIDLGAGHRGSSNCSMVSRRRPKRTTCGTSSCPTTRPARA